MTRFILTIVCAQYPEEVRPVQIVGDPGPTNWHMGEPGEEPSVMTLTHVMAAIIYFESKAVNPLPYTYTLTPAE